MNLELLPNEILLDLFNCFNVVDLLRAFYGLNVRFNLLLYKQFRAYRFHFDSFSKRNFDMICQQHLPFITDRVITLSLSDDEKTPGQISLFFSYISSLHQFTYLRFLSLFNLHSYQILMKIFNELHYLCNLTRLSLYSCSCQNDHVDFQLIVNNIWSLPKLIYCYFDVSIQQQENFCLPTKLSTSLKDLFIFQHTLNFNQIHTLLDYTSHLKSLLISIESDENEDYQSLPLLTLTNLIINVSRISDTSKLISFLQNTSNLCRLNVNLQSNLINGYQWKQIIRNYLPKLKVFKLTMKNELSSNQNIQARADELINSFQNSFWIDEHRWFVRCFTCDTKIYLETLSENFRYLERKLPDWWKSTYPCDDREKFFNTMRSIYYTTFFDQAIPSFIRWENIYHLCVKLPITDAFWSVVPSFERLHSLTVSSHTDTFQSQLQTLLNRASHLYGLTIYQDASLPLQISLFKYTAASIRKLDLQSYNHQFNEEECISLSRSSLGVQCEILFIQVKNRESIIILVQNMIHLRALHVQCEDEKDSEHIPLIMNGDENTSHDDELIQWLKDHLPSTCLILKDRDFVGRIQLWIQ